ncbi:LAME_0E05996g1_1 [Lachancea meyersii CBS 8951]|uniref:LAME_0E05996g1_1 n=1 Tax=Lachancea meyersii CBS 8951 TaxID=1266667 RepID=A0A1G4JHY8_9SACH|nr:LAME_0E05996g1_1 [Lachancea meyersii CBS 8951]
MSHSLADLFRARLFHSDSLKRKEASPDLHEFEHRAQGQEFLKQATSSSALNSIREEERILPESYKSECTSRGSPDSLQKSAKGGKLRGLKKRIASFPDLKFRSSSSLSSEENALSDSNSASVNASKSGTMPWSRKNHKSRLDCSGMSPKPLDISAVINITNEDSDTFDTKPPRQLCENYSEKRLSSGSMTRINTASSNASSVRAVRQTRFRRPMIRSNSDNYQAKSASSSQLSLSLIKNDAQGTNSTSDAAVARRRSRTVGAADYEGKGIPLRVSLGKLRIRSNSGSEENVVVDKTAGGTSNPKTYLAAPATQSRSRRPSNSKQSFSSSRRSSSLVTALSSFVTMRSISVSSRSSSPKVVKTLDDFSKPSEPLPDDTEEQYLKSLSSYGKFIAIILATDNDAFKISCLHYFLKTEFDFRMEPLDLSLRKLLMFLELPKESQQIDRVLNEFSKIYYDQNRDSCFWESEEEVFFLGFSLLMLHTDAFNPNNKIKMTKQDFVKLMRYDSTSELSRVPREIFEYFFDNVTAREFSQYEDLHSSGPYSSEVIDSEQQSGLEVEYSPRKIIKDGGLHYRRDSVGNQSENFEGVLTPSASCLPNASFNAAVNPASKNDAIDVYFHIISDSVPSVSLYSQLGPSAHSDDNTVKENLNNRQHPKYISIVQETKGGYLRLPKCSIENILGPNMTTLSPSGEERNFRYLKIVQMGEFEEMITNRKFSIVGNVNRVVFKRYFGILTTSCLLLFNGMGWMEPKMVVDETTQVSNYIIDCPSTVQAAQNFGCGSLFAIDVPCSDRESKEVERPNGLSAGRYTLDVYSNNKKLTFACPNKQERDNWIDAINVTTALDGCFMTVGTISDTVVNMRKISPAEKLEKLQRNRVARAKKFEHMQKLIFLVRRSVPLNAKVRSSMMEYLLQLERRFSWLQYEACRSEVLSRVLQLVGETGEDVAAELNNEHSIDQSFIFNESLETCASDTFTDAALDTTFDGEGFLRSPELHSCAPPPSSS